MAQKAKKKAKAKTRKSPPVTRKARTPRLPGMEDAGIPALERVAEEYADIRDSRIALSKDEGEKQDDLIKLMKKFGKTEYHHEEVHIWLQFTEEKVKVKIGELSPARARKESNQTVKVISGGTPNQEGDEGLGEETEAASA